MKNPEEYNDFQTKLELIQQKFKTHLASTIKDTSELWDLYIRDNAYPEVIMESLRFSLHKIAGSSGTFGLAEISQVANKCEELFTVITDNKREPFDNEISEISNLIKCMRDLYFAPSTESPIVFPIYSNVKSHDKLIYLVDDDSFLSESLTHEIEFAGFEIHFFTNLQDFRTACEQVMPTIVIMDMMFTEGEHAGAEEISRMRKESHHQFHVVYISACDDIQSRLAALRSGGTQYFTKPISSHRLVSTLAELCDAGEQLAYRVLLVDDDKDVLAFHSIMLDHNDIIVESESDPFAVLNKIRSFCPELLILDVYMPDCSGFELAQIIRQDQEFMNLPIIFLTSENKIDKHLMGLDLEGDDFLTKPVKPEFFSRIVRARLRRSRRAKQLTDELLQKAKDDNLLKSAINQHAIVSVTDNTGKINFVNEKFCETSGFTIDELVGKTYSVINSGVHEDDFFENLWQTISNGNVWQGDICNKNKQGSNYWVKSTIFPLCNDDAVPYQFISIHTDITQNKNAIE